MPNYRSRLSRAQQRVYDRSDAVSSIPLKVSPRLRAGVLALAQALEAGECSSVESASRVVADEICGALRVPTIKVLVQGSRPADRRGELHGLYTALPDGSATVKVWMITAKLGRVVAFKTFLRTLLHEICHHLDYRVLRLADSLHTDGFYKRESSLFHQIGGDQVAARRRPEAAARSRDGQKTAAVRRPFTA